MFPQLHNTEIVSCFNCYQDHYDPHIVKTDNAQGKYYMVCESCGMRTFFDLIGDNDGSISQNK